MLYLRRVARRACNAERVHRPGQRPSPCPASGSAATRTSTSGTAAPVRGSNNATSAAGADLRPGLDQGEGDDLGRGIDARVLGDRRCRMHSGAQGRRRVEQGGHPRPARVGFGGDDRPRSRRHPGEHVGMHDHRPGCGSRQRRGVAPVVEEAHLLRPRHVQRRDARKQQVRFRRRGTVRGLGHPAERVRPAAREEARVADRHAVRCLPLVAGHGRSCRRAWHPGKAIQNGPEPYRMPGVQPVALTASQTASEATANIASAAASAAPSSTPSSSK
jgi:hypothetical protein